MKRIKGYYCLPLMLMMLCLSACHDQQGPDAQEIVDQAIQQHGGERYNSGIVSFRFRDRQYRALRDNGAFVYSRSFTDSTGQQVHDVLRNSGFTRSVNEQEVVLPEERKAAFTASVNSVIYFALLPYFLNDEAAQKEFIGEETVKGEPYYKVRVTFAEEGGGEDHEDEFLYWFHQRRHTLDYLAYSYEEEGEGVGSRFRVAVNPREVGGIRFQDYLNYTSPEAIPLTNYARAYEAGKLRKVSEINLENVVVGALQ